MVAIWAANNVGSCRGDESIRGTKVRGTISGTNSAAANNGIVVEQVLINRIDQLERTIKKVEIKDEHKVMVVLAIRWKTEIWYYCAWLFARSRHLGVFATRKSVSVLMQKSNFQVPRKCEERPTEVHRKERLKKFL